MGRTLSGSAPAHAPGRPRRRWPRVALALLLALAAVAWVAQTPPGERLPHFAEHTPSVIAHAGAQGHAPPNTIEAFEAALELGADTLEMDLQRSADGHVVVIHDGTVDGTTDGSGRVADLTLAELRELDAGWAFEGPGGDFPHRGRGVRIPTLGEVFETFPDTFMVLEMKTDGGEEIVEAVAETVAAHGREDSVVVASFDLEYLRRFRALLPDVPTNMAEDEVRTFHVLHLLGLHRWWRPPGEFFQVPEYHEDTHVVTERFVRAADRLGIDVQVWTVNEPGDIQRLLGTGAHGIMTDYPERVAEALRGS